MNTATIPLIMPYPGLRPFEETDHALFFGREAQVSALLRQLEDHAFVAVLGSSGSGKSSLVRAGLIPAVREGFLLATTKWRFLVIRPGHRPYQRLVRALTDPMDSYGENRSASVGDETATPEESQVLSTLLGNDRGLLTVLDESGMSADTNVIIVVDQFEELFAFRRAGTGRGDIASRDEVAAFVNTLLCACAEPDGRVRVVLTMRSDFVGDCEAFLGLPEAVSRSQFLVPRLDRVQMEDAITRPGTIKEADFRPFSFEQGLVNRIINDAGDRPDQLPLMQHALMRTWKLAIRRAKQDGTSAQLMHKDYNDAGGITEALSRHAEDAWKLIEGDQKKEEIVRRLFLLLCDISPDGQITRRRPRVTEVQAVTGAGKEELERLIRLFQEDDRNFLFPRLDHQNARDFLDIGHETLLRQWPRFSRWQEQERQDASELERLAEQAVLHSQKAGGLLSAADLVRIAEWNRRVSVEWAHRYVKQEAWENVVAFIKESENDVKKQARKKWGLLALIVIVLMAATAISLVLMFQANSAKAAAQRALTDSFFRTIGLSSERSLDERASLWDLAELAPENVRVRETVIDLWFKTEKDVLRGLNNDARGLRAASGLSVALMKRIISRSKELADRIVTVLENSQQIDSYRLADFDKAAAALAARMDPQEVARIADRIVTVLEKLLQTDSYRLAEFGKAVAALAARMEPQEAARIATRSAHVLVTALEKLQQTGIYHLADFGEAVAALAARMDPQEVARIADRIVTVLENSQQTDSSRLAEFGKAVEALAARMEPQEAARIATRSAHVLVTALEKLQQTDSYRLAEFGKAVEALAARMEPQEAARIATRSAHVLVTALEKLQQTDSSRLAEFGKTVAALAARMEPQEAARIADRIVTVLENPQQTDSSRLAEFGKAVEALAARMEPQEAARIATRSAHVLVTALEKLQQTDSYRLAEFGKAVEALAARMEPQEAARIADRIVTVLENPQQTNRSRLADLGKVVEALAARMEPQEAARIADRIVTVLENPQQTDSYRLANLSKTVAALAARMEPQEAVRIADRIVTVLENPQQTNRSRLAYLSKVVEALAARMEPQEAARIADRIVTVLENSQQTNRSRLAYLSEVVEALAARMEPQEAARIATRSAHVLVTALENPQQTDDKPHPAYLSEVVEALAARMEPQEAARIADRIVTVLENSQQTDDKSHPVYLSEVVKALAARMDPQEAARIATRSAHVLVTALENPQQTDSYRLVDLGERVEALVARMEPQEAVPVATRSAHVLVTALENPQQTDSYRLVEKLSGVVAALVARMEPQEAVPVATRSAHVLVTALENPPETFGLLDLRKPLVNLAKFLPAAQQRATLLLALSHISLEGVPSAPQQGQEVAQEEPKVWKEVTELCQLLSRQDLAEVLKWPFTVGEAEKIVLTELERQTGQTFDGDVWKFVEQAQSLGITGLDAPAKRPRIEDKELDRR